MSASIEIDQLREGMFVHLDLGWWQHPFALSSFMIASAEQIATLRALGLRRVRWSPERSRLDAADSVGGASAWGALRPAGDAAPVDNAVRRGAALAAQRAAEHVCAQQHAEAGRAWTQAAELVHRAPMQARDIAEALTRSILDKMLASGEVCVRVVTDAHGPRATTHAVNVGVISMLMGRAFGLAGAEMLDIGLGALLHDIGKLELPERVRHPDPDFTQAEHALYREHVARGQALASRMGLPPGVAQVLAQHHEMADGSGFPQRLNVDQMTVAARVVALVNRYDNLCNPGNPAHALTPHEALSLIFAQSKGKFDASMLNAFIRMMGVYPPGSVVQLTDDRYATVVSANASRPLKPRVLACDPGVPPSDALLLDLESQPDLGIRRSVRPSQLPREVRDWLSPRSAVVYFFEPALRREPSEVLAA